MARYARGGEYSCGITGESFAEDVTCAFSHGIEVKSLVRESETKLNVVILVPHGAPIGDEIGSIQVTNPHVGSVLLENCFTIVEGPPTPPGTPPKPGW